eukprot:SAG31_NODE_1062_length_10105_cov_11.143814_10_plen_51_part_01
MVLLVRALGLGHVGWSHVGLAGGGGGGGGVRNFSFVREGEGKNPQTGRVGW